MVVLLGVGSAMAAGAASWRDVQKLPAQTHELLPADEEPPVAPHRATTDVSGAR